MTAPNNPPEYNPNIPEKSTTIAEAQELFKDNFLTLFDAFGVNHIALNDPTNPGNHNVIQLIEQDKSRNTQVDEIAIYSKKVDGQNDQLFMRYPQNGKEFQITEYQIYAIQPTDKQEAYFTFLPGKIMMYFGRVFSHGTKTFNIDINPPIKTNISGVNLAGINNPPTFQPNVSLQTPTNGFYTTIILNTVATLPDQFYLFFGNL
jgi:hypothetical protein